MRKEKSDHRFKKISKLLVFLSVTVMLTLAVSNAVAQGFKTNKQKLDETVNMIPIYPPLDYGAGYNEAFKTANDQFQDYVFMLQNLKNEADKIESEIEAGCLKLADNQTAINKCQQEHLKRVRDYSAKFDAARQSAELELRRRLDLIAKYWDSKSPSVLRRDGKTGQVYSQRPSGIIKIGPKQAKKPVRVGPPQGKMRNGRIVY